MPKIVDHETYKEDLLQKAMPIFVERNYADVSMRDIATMMNISTGALYHYFPSKEELFCALFIYSSQMSVKNIFNAMCGISSLEAKLDMLFEQFVHQCTDMNRQFLFSTDLLRNQMRAKADELLKSWASQLNKDLRNVLGLSEEDGLMVFTFLAGTLYGRSILPSYIHFDPALNAFKRLLIQNLNSQHITN